MKLLIAALWALASLVETSPAPKQGHGVAPRPRAFSVAKGSTLSPNTDHNTKTSPLKRSPRILEQAEEQIPEMGADQVGDKTVTVILGNQRQNVGNLVGPALYHEVYIALQSACAWYPEYDGRCNPNIIRRVQIDYFAPSNRINQEYLEVKVTSSYHYNNAKLRNLMIGTIAAAIQRSSEDSKNCVSLTPWRTTTHCNIGDRIRVEISRLDHMEVSFRSSQRYGHFDCVAIVEATDRDVQSLLPEYAEVFGGRKLLRNVYCPAKEVT